VVAQLTFPHMTAELFIAMAEAGRYFAGTR
jgi:hypothetical protein